MDLLLTKEDWSNFWPPISLSLQVSLIATVCVIVSGIILAALLARKKFKGKVLLETCLLLPIVLPPTVTGFLLLVVFGRNSIIGKGIEWLFHQPIIFTWWAAVIAAFIVSFPLMYQSAKAGFIQIDRSIEEAARVDGANEWKILTSISIPLASHSLISGSILSFARGLGEFGATLMFAGNIPGKTQTLPTAIYVAIETGNMKMAWIWVITITIISFIMLALCQPKQQ